MDRSTELSLMRLLHGELPPEEARALTGRLEREPDLALRYQRLRERWEGLALPPEAPPPPGFGGRVMAHVRGVEREAREGAPLSWSLAPTWVRAAAAAALVAGMALGAGLGRLPSARTTSDVLPGSGIGGIGERVPLADSYWSVFEEDTAGARGGGARP